MFWTPHVISEGVCVLTTIGFVYMLGVHKKATERANAYREEAIVDALTGLPNRRCANHAIVASLQSTQKRGAPLSAILVDLDHFKRINDTRGHDAGDAVLREVGATLKRSVRSTDLAARWGGEEFFLMMPETPAGAAAERAETIRQRIADLSVSHRGAPVGSVTASFGVASSPHHATEAERLRRMADGALYRAKADGRDRVVVAAY